MSRLNLTLDADTILRLEKHAQALGRARTSVARELIVEALDRMERRTKLEKLAADYAQGQSDAQDLLAELEVGQLERLDG